MDGRADAWIGRQGIATLRLQAKDVRSHPDGVIDAILIAAGLRAGD